MKRKLGLLSLIIVAVAAFFIFDLNQYLTLDYAQSRLGDFHAFYAENRLISWVVFFVIYVVVTALSLPGAAVMTLISGALFGLVTGVILVSFASTIGATLAFLVARFLLYDWVQERFADKLKAINKGVEKDGAMYLFTLRLVPVFPFFLINLVMALTPMKAWTFFWVSQVGMLAGTIVYVNAGTQLAEVQAVGDLMSLQLIGAFVLLGLFPWIARAIVSLVRRLQVYRGWEKPGQFDRNMIVIGGGSAGLVAAYIGATVRASVTLVEKGNMGGDCLNTGCVPSKALIKSASVAQQTRKASLFGIQAGEPRIEFNRVMERIQDVIRRIEPHDSVERFTSLGVDCRQGTARLVSPWEVEITARDGTTERLTARNIIIAAGAEPLVPPVPGLGEVDYLTSDTLWQERECPERLLVLGGGPIGSELAQSMARLGSHVTQVEMAPRLLGREEPEASDLLAESMRADGVNLLLGHKAVRFAREGDEQAVYLETSDGEEKRVVFDKVLVALGRRANTSALGLDELGIGTTEAGTLDLNEYLQTRYPNIYACGDVAGPYQFTHTAAHQAWHAAVNALFGQFRKFRVDYSVIPWCTFTSPEVARVGLNEQDAEKEDVAFEVTRYGIDDLDRAIADGTDEGFVKVLTRPGTDKILGVTIVGAHAGDLITEYILAMRHGIGLNKILGTIHIYPTLAEANKFAAGEWKKAHAPEAVLRWLGRYHHWRLGRGGSSVSAEDAAAQREQ